MEVPDWEDLGGPFYRALKDNADAYIMTNDKNLFRAGIAFEGAGFRFHNLGGRARPIQRASMIADQSSCSA